MATILIDDKETFSLFMMENETDEQFELRVWERAWIWTDYASRSHIPSTGHVRDIWDMYMGIRAVPTDMLREDIYESETDDQQYWDNKEGMYCRAWVAMARKEMERRRGRRE